MLVERTLDPLVRGASSREILGLRILDPAMGSGALLASALRYLVAAVETAWVREGRGGPLDVPRHERESLPRCIAEQCLYGVDVNARAVDVARLSIWLLSMAPDRPLTWLDAHLRVGNSLVGTSPSTILSRVPGRDRCAASPRGRPADAVRPGAVASRGRRDRSDDGSARGAADRLRRCGRRQVARAREPAVAEGARRVAGPRRRMVWRGDGPRAAYERNVAGRGRGAQGR